MMQRSSSTLQLFQTVPRDRGGVACNVAKIDNNQIIARFINKIIGEEGGGWFDEEKWKVEALSWQVNSRLGPRCGLWETRTRFAIAENNRGDIGSLTGKGSKLEREKKFTTELSYVSLF